MTETTSLRRSIYETLGEVANAFASPARLKIIQVLAQKNRTVEELSTETGETVANVSQHLQKLAKAGLVSCERRGTSRIYRARSPRVIQIWEAFQDLGHELVGSLDERENQITNPALRASGTPLEILRAVRNGKALLIDVRDEDESSATPVKDALAVPLKRLREKLQEKKNARELGLHKNKIIYAVCRGRYCSLASDAVTLLRKQGYDAYRMRESAFRLNLISKEENK